MAGPMAVAETEQTVNRIPALPGAVMMLVGILGWRWSIQRLMKALGGFQGVAKTDNVVAQGVAAGAFTDPSSSTNSDTGSIKTTPGGGV